jgi:hypothetical protein
MLGRTISASLMISIASTAACSGEPVEGVTTGLGSAESSTTNEPSDPSSDAGDDGGPSSTPGESSAGPVADSSSGASPTCGDGSCDADEGCTECPEDCGGCEPIPCGGEGGLYCGGDGVGGDPSVLYVCHGGLLEVLEECGEMCSYMPNGIPDRCPSETVVPPSLIDLLDDPPYVEQDCEPTVYPGWPYSAQECTYSAGGISTSVTVANPPAERVGAWIVDAAAYIPELDALAEIDAAAYEDGLAAIGLHMLYQSSRIFPLAGGIVEDLGGGAEIFPFSDGISDPCSSGCYCRINSLHRTEWCAYRAALGDDYDGCIGELGDSGHTDAWAGHCLDNHAAAWNSDSNEHFRAKALLANEAVDASCPRGACSPAQVVDAVRSAYGL